MPTPLGESLSLAPSPTKRNRPEITSPSLETGAYLGASRTGAGWRSLDQALYEDVSLQDTPSSDREAQSARNKKRPPHLSPVAVGYDQTPLASSTSVNFDLDSRHERTPMPKKSPFKSPDVKSENGHTTGTLTPMLEQRKRNLSFDGAHLLGEESYNLDDDPLQTPRSGRGASAGFSELPPSDRRNFLLLVLLYFLQGIPMGLATGSVPFLLKSHLSYGQIGIFSLASYPYSMKLLWSPIVDAVWNRRVGRRKSWIVPIQALSGIGMLWLGSQVDEMMEKAGAYGGAGVWGFTGWWFFLVFMCATQDIAVDGWALSLLSPQNLSYASTAQTVGLVAGQFLSHTVFLAFNAPDFANKWFRAVPRPDGVLSLGGYLKFWGYAYLIVTVGLAILKKENSTKNQEGIMEVYRIMGKIMSLRNIQLFVFIHLIAKIGFVANDAVTNLKLLDKGLSQEDLALTVLIDFPFEVSLGYFVGKWSSIYPPLHIWCYAFIGRMCAAIFAQFTVWVFPAQGVNGSYLLLVIAQHLFSTFMNTVQFVAVSAFHAKVADPAIGGTYMTILATCSNLGGTFPRFFVLKFVDLFTRATCIPPTSPPIALKADLVTSPFSCALEADKHRCIDGGGRCHVERDGYFYANGFCILLAFVTFFWFIKPVAYKLQELPLRAWRLS